MQGILDKCFAFQLTTEEFASLRSQTATLKPGRGQHRKYRPYAFTEHGALMAANVLNSPEAVAMSVYVVRAFIKQRELLRTHTEILKKIAQIDAKLLQHDDVLRAIVHELQPLINPPPLRPNAKSASANPEKPVLVAAVGGEWRTL